ncbi:ricin-type beta-trefoil lectin domain protein [Kitasatospora sp. NPDC048365]|uniref:ricin-type beta-trefoil lectin domain protein n=1 Tax=Kitasatospora sp. NPDC048365 TaxID=3364050 RepID=UPI00371A54C7
MREPRSWRPPRTALAAALCGLVLSTGAGPALADDRPFAVPPGTAQAPAAPGLTAGGAVQAARLAAKQTGKPVTVDALTTETTLTTAGPDGKLTVTTNLRPARVKRGDRWTAVDATLRKGGDGSWSPAATPTGVRLSGGGTGPLATLTDRDGRSLALTFPVKLPAPTVTGSTATYPQVLPGVDLTVDVTDQGAVREVLVVKDAASAGNPALKALTLSTATQGLTLTADPAGNLTAAGADGKAAFRAPAPVMWDSAGAPAAKGSKGTKGGSGLASGADDASAERSTADGPGRGAKVEPIGVKAADGALTLTPDGDLLGGKDTVWPLYIDPTFQPAPTIGRSHFAQVMEGCAGARTYDVAHPNGEGVGYQHYESSCRGAERSYFEFDLGVLTKDMYIDSARAFFTETYGADWNCRATAPVTVRRTWGINGDTTWATKPDPRQDGETKWLESASTHSGCGSHGVDFDVTGMVRDAVRDGGPLTVGLYGDETAGDSNNRFMRFANNPSLVATYDLAPYAPDANYTSPASINPDGPACGSGEPGWIGRTTTLGNGAADLTLHAYARTPMPGTNIQVGFHVWDNMTADAAGDPATASWPVSEAIYQQGWGHANVGGPLGDGHQYGWNAWATDGLLGSPGSPYCYFNVDLSAPDLAAVTPSGAFPPLGSGIRPTAHAGDAGATVRVTSTDPTPGGCTRGSCLKSGVRGFQYALDDNIPPTGAQTVWVTPDANGTATADIPINLNPDQWGTHRLYVRAFDGAGNTQPNAAAYDFYAPWNPDHKVVAGDLDFDGTPDTLLQAPDGSLTLLPGNSDLKAQPGTASTRTQTPEADTDAADTWNNYLIAHRGSATENSVDDLFAYSKASRQLYIYANDSTRTPAGTPGHFGNRSGITQIGNSNACAKGVDGTWNHISRLTAVSAAPTTKGRTNLVTVEQGHLRFYPGSTVAGCALATGVELGDSTDWAGFTLLSPGTVGDQPALWVRDTVTGAISNLPLPLPGGTPAANSLHAPAHGPLVSAVRNTRGETMCADINGAQTWNGTAAQLWDCNTTGAQAFTAGTDGTLHVLGKCLDVTGGARDNGSPVNLYDCNGTPAQQWTTGPHPGTLQNPNSGRCLAVPEGRGEPGNRLIIWDCLDDDSQRWQAPAAAPVLPGGFSSAAYPAVDSPGDLNGDGRPDLIATDTNGTITQYLGTTPADGRPRFGAPQTLPTAAPTGYNINSAQNPGRCLDNWGADNGTAVRLYDCWAGASQKFTFAADGTLRTGGRCVTTTGTWNGAGVTSQDCTGTTGQTWTLRTDGTLHNPASGRCLELPGWNDANGTALGIWDCAASHANQRWTYFPNTA